jgi:flavin reductase
MSKAPPTSAETVSAEAFTSALAHAANGVSVVTTGGEHGKAGLTVSSMCSVCADPALILACVHAENEFCRAASANGAFAINILSTNNLEVSKVFAGIGGNPDADRFQTGEWTTKHTGSPILQNALVSLDCITEDAHVHGTHCIYIGRVIGAYHSDGQPLVYAMREFGQTTTL